jgi:hypothetical protein
LALAWVLAAAAGEHLMPLRRSLALATACLLVAAPLVYWRWEGAEEGEEEGPPEAEEVLFKYEASFTYLGSKENLPLMGYDVLFPCPTVDNEPVITKENLRWQLWGPVNNWLVLEVDNNNVIQFVEQRENQPYPWEDNWGFIHSYGQPGEPFHKPWLGYLKEYGITWKIILQNDFDNIYPGEMIKSEGYFSLPAELIGSVTLEEDNETVRQENGEVLAGNIIWLNKNEVQAVNVSFQVQLFQKVNDNFTLLERFVRVEENTNAKWIELFLA